MALEPQERERPEAGRARAGRRVTTLLMGVAAVAAVAAVGVFAYKEGLRRGAESVAPVITAGPAPDKVKPDNPGGMEVPNQDKQIYNQLSPETAQKPVEHLLPPPEQPMAPPAAPAAGPTTTPAPPAGPAAPVAQAADRSEMQPPPMERSAPPAAPHPPPPPPTAAKPAPPPAAAPSAEPNARARAAGGYRVQLASVRTEEQANRVIARAKRANADIVGDLTFSAVRADLGSRGIYYRVQAGPLADAASAKTLCEKLKARKQGCLVVAP